ncbi:MAG: pyridoxine 5'-phosphate synthase [Candidatus Omnitrophica bacterium]|nr:pyridoxine 5'-phosphate synthase [Candidatus Omnitrophota bacterium]
MTPHHLRLGVNVDHVATLRQARRGPTPDPVEAALICERAGAQSIVCHLREDRRHIQDRDVQRLKRSIATRLNLEMSLAPDIVKRAIAVRPAQVTLVPEHRQELTTEGGLDVIRLSRRLRPLIDAFGSHGIEVSLFVDPVLGHLAAVRDLGVSIVELHTGRYATARTLLARRNALSALARAAAGGNALGLTVAAGHGLEYENIRAVAAIPEIQEVNIGFSIVVRALAVGFERAVQEMAALLQPQRTVHALQPA